MIENEEGDEVDLGLLLRRVPFDNVGAFPPYTACYCLLEDHFACYKAVYEEKIERDFGCIEP